VARVDTVGHHHYIDGSLVADVEGNIDVLRLAVARRASERDQARAS
jgi:hypothetical protein